MEAVNEEQTFALVNKVFERFGKQLEGRRFALWGLAFKPNTDDMREAPSRVVIAELVRRGATLKAYDPVAMPEAKRVLEGTQGLVFVDNQTEALHGSDALLIVTEWKEFKSPDFDTIKSLLKQAVVIDGRNLYEPALLAALGISYEGVGRAGPAATALHDGAK